MSAAAEGFIHVYRPGSRSDNLTLLLLHGTGADEHDLIPIGDRLAPGAAILSPRGKVLENGYALRWFARHPDGSFDEQDLRQRTQELAGFISAAGERYNFTPSSTLLVGYSNGANIGAALLLLHPELIGSAVLLRAMDSLKDVQVPDLAGKAVLITAGQQDPWIPLAGSLALKKRLEQAGAAVELHLEEGGHALTLGQIEAARIWLEQHLPKTS